MLSQQFRRKLSRNTRCLGIESLEARRVLNGDAVLPTPPPVDNNVGLVSFHSQSRYVEADSYRGQVQVVDTGFSASEVDGTQGKPAPILSGDFNGDSVTDFLSADSADNWYLHLNDGTQLFELPVGSGLAGFRQLGTADFDQDGKLDVISMHPSSGELWVSLNRSSNFFHQRWGQFSNPSGWSELIVGDYNGDGRPDLLGGEIGGHWWLAQNYEGTKFQNHRWGRFADFAWLDVLEGEFTGDQIADVVARAPDNTWWLWEGSASGFQDARYFGHWKMRSDWMDVAVADFNGDQMDDVIGRSDDGKLWVGSATPNGFHTWTWADGWIDRANWSQVTIVDMNADGLPDQVGHADGDTWWYAMNTGSGFQNHFWQRRGEVEFVVEGFKRSNAVDLTGSLPRKETEPQETREMRVTLDDQNRIVLWPEEPISISSVHVSEPNGSLVTKGGGDIYGFKPSSGATFCTVRWTGETPFEGPVTLGVGWDPQRGSLDASVRVYRQLGPGELFYGADYSAQLQSESEVAPNGRTIPTHNCTEDDEVHTSGTASIVDGRIILNGTFAGLAGIEVTSKGGFLSLKALEVPGIGEIDFKAPFDYTAAIVTKSSSQIVIGVLGAENRISIQGENPTAILYSGSFEDALGGDLLIRIGIGDGPPVRVEVVD